MCLKVYFFYITVEAKVIIFARYIVSIKHNGTIIIDKFKWSRLTLKPMSLKVDCHQYVHKTTGRIKVKFPLEHPWGETTKKPRYD